MINLINADKVLKQLYLSMIEEELNKTKEQPKVADVMGIDALNAAADGIGLFEDLICMKE